MRIAILIPNLGPGGAERLLFNTIPLYSARGHEVVLYLLKGQNNRNEYVQLIKENASIKYLKSRSSYNPLILWELKKILKNEEFVHVHLFPINLMLVLAKKVFGHGCIINTDHGLANYYKLAPKRFDKLKKFLYRGIDYHIAISDTIQRKIESHLLKEQYKSVYKIYNGIDIQEITNMMAISLIEILPGYKKNVDDKFILMTARFHPGKRHDILLEALSQLPEQFKCIFIGSPEIPENIQTIIAKNNLKHRIYNLGFYEYPFQLMKAVNYNVLLSDSEGLSGVVIESLASGVPFIGSDVEGIRDIVPSKLHLINDADSLVKRIMEVEADPVFKKQLCVDGKRASLNFDIKKMVDGHLMLYEKIYSLN